ncbi:DUF4326 domain-containing protein [Kitasatospora purpeofusca]|uniref:DUF4326 domain-containing protein n=1 Tax=Kitasatospora purpeofusca TaxID=67352 RepID=UPI003647371F
MPTRHQRRRTAGWRAPAGAVYVGRGTMWGNPWPVVRQADGDYGVPPVELGGPWPTFTHETDARTEALRLYRGWLAERPEMASLARRKLAGRDLMCWCPTDQPCHADVLLELANVPVPAAPSA